MKSPLTKEERAEMRRRVQSLAREECDPASTILDLIDSHDLADEALDLATAKLATAKVCEECGGKGKRLINNCVAGTVASYEIKCPHCTNGVQFSDERARELLERLRRVEEDSELLDWLEKHCDDLTVLRDIMQPPRFQLDFCFESSGCPGEVQEDSLREAIRAAREKEGAQRAKEGAAK